jgi:hypothetical protein
MIRGARRRLLTEGSIRLAKVAIASRWTGPSSGNPRCPRALRDAACQSALAWRPGPKSGDIPRSLSFPSLPLRTSFEGLWDAEQFGSPRSEDRPILSVPLPNGGGNLRGTNEEWDTEPNGTPRLRWAGANNHCLKALRRGTGTWQVGGQKAYLLVAIVPWEGHRPHPSGAACRLRVALAGRKPSSLRLNRVFLHEIGVRPWPGLAHLPSCVQSRGMRLVPSCPCAAIRDTWAGASTMRQFCRDYLRRGIAPGDGISAVNPLGDLPTRQRSAVSPVRKRNDLLNRSPNSADLGTLPNANCGNGHYSDCFWVGRMR